MHVSSGSMSLSARDSRTYTMSPMFSLGRFRFVAPSNSSPLRLRSGAWVLKTGGGGRQTKEREKGGGLIKMLSCMCNNQVDRVSSKFKSVGVCKLRYKGWPSRACQICGKSQAGRVLATDALGGAARANIHVVALPGRARDNANHLFSLHRDGLRRTDCHGQQR